ncbi:hypothetical protein KQI68_09905 [Peptoniphilus sp. MSJ-1]|uniref:ABC-2 type transporter n=1 Tax=Peptoniphilus ovalis TaxID=2841503 RepID=A0ABS6FJA8_9FIRM|nr:hypothetical protein [Peptoniphilus ovalis]MBU5670143.1 hypothetical protein [Peptoniphilus ovalis]
MNFFEDLQLVYKRAFNETINNIKKNPIILIVPLIYSIIYTFAFAFMGTLLAPVGMLMGFLMPVMTSLILSSYYSMLSDLIYYNRLSFRNLKNTFQNYFASIYSVYFILILISWLMPVLMATPGVGLLFSLILALALNPIAESIYIQGEYYTEAYKSSFNFMKENFILWLIPFAIYLLILFLLGFDFRQILLSSSIIDIPLGQNLVTGIYLGDIFNIYNLKVLIAMIATAIYAVFRGNLYKILYGSTRRKRAYMGEL